MSKLVSSERMAAIDGAAQGRFGYPQPILMENAGIKAYQFVRDRYWGTDGPGGTVVFAAGPGNNGGDALVMARQCWLDGYTDMTVMLLKDELSGSPETNRLMCERLGIPLVSFRKDPEAATAMLGPASWIFDGISGTGISGALRSPYLDAATAINDARARVVAIDVPSGLSDEFEQGFPAVQATVTVTMGLPKRCLYTPVGRPFGGTIHVISLGFPPALIHDDELLGEVLAETDLPALVPPVPATTYKNKRGVAAVFAGAPGTTGAAVLAAEAAARCRAGLVSIMAESAVYPVLAGQVRSVMAKPWDPNSDPGSFDFSPYTGLVIGPGWGLNERKQRWLSAMADSGLPASVDADGLALLRRVADDDGRPSGFLGGRWVLTPHPGEFAAFADAGRSEVPAHPLLHCRRVAERYGAVVLLKGHVTWIVAPDGRHSVVDGMNPAMATGGAGDVLAGLIGALLCAGLSAYQAARAGALLHAVAGARAYRRRGWFLSEDLPAEVSEVLRDVDERRHG